MTSANASIWQSVSLVAMRGGSAALLLALHVLVARLIPQSEYGVYILVLAWVNVLSVAAMIGMDIVAVRYVAALISDGDWGQLRHLLNWAMKLLALTSILALCVLLVSAAMAVDASELAWLIGALTAPFWVFNIFLVGVLLGLKLPHLALLPHHVFRPLLAALAVLVLIFPLNAPRDARVVLFCELLSSASALSILLYLVLRRIRPVERKLDRAAEKIWLASGLAIAGTALGSVAISQIDVAVLGAYRSYEEVATFGVAIRISTLLSLVLAALNNYAAPRFAEFFQRQDFDSLQSLAVWVARVATTSALIFALVVILFGRDLLMAFGSSFSSGWVALCILTLGQCVNCFVGSVLYLLTMTGHHKQAVRWIALSVILNISLSLLLVPNFGVLGASISSAVTMTALNIGLLREVQSRLRISPVAIGRELLVRS